MIGTAGALQELPGHHHAPSRIGLVLHPERDATPVLETVRRWAGRTGATVRVSEDPSARAELAADSKLLLAVGGDATLHEAMRLAAPHGIPVLGVDLGRLGHLSELEVRRLGRALDALERGEFTVEPRTALTFHLGRGGPIQTFNDVVARRGQGRSEAMLALHADGDLISRQAGDGLIVSPRPETVVVTPLAPDEAANRSLVLSHDQPIVLKVLRYSSPVALEIEGRDHIELPPDSRLVVEAASNAGRGVRLWSGYAGRLRRR
jgi:NAD+ kinase